jgi:hypothetical protein
MEPEIVSQQISRTLEEMISKLKFMIEEIEYQIHDGKEKHKDSLRN